MPSADSKSSRTNSLGHLLATPTQLPNTEATAPSMCQPDVGGASPAFIRCITPQSRSPAVLLRAPLEPQLPNTEATAPSMRQPDVAGATPAFIRCITPQSRSPAVLLRAPLEPQSLIPHCHTLSSPAYQYTLLTAVYIRHGDLHVCVSKYQCWHLTVQLNYSNFNI
jgi:hypothetical protein